MPSSSEGPAPSRGRRVRLEINLGAIRRNFRRIADFVHPASAIAVLKANAYGLGVAPVAAALKEAGVSGFGAAELNEALELRELGLPVQILGNLLPEEVECAVANGIEVPVGDMDMCRRLAAVAGAQGRRVTCHIAVDSGMGRLGCDISEAAGLAREAAKIPELNLKGIFSHFPQAYIQDDNFTRRQIDAVKRLVSELAADGIKFQKVHIAASDGISNYPECAAPPFTQVRAGLNLYGYYDDQVRHAMPLEPVVELKTSLAAVRTIPAGHTVGYGRTHRLPVDTRAGIVAAGYADGLPLALSNRGYLLVRGVLCPILGRISMDYTCVSLNNVPDACWGDEVVCFGRQKDNCIPINDWAALKGTHVYDILCSIGSRVERRCFDK